MSFLIVVKWLRGMEHGGARRVDGGYTDLSLCSLDYRELAATTYKPDTRAYLNLLHVISLRTNVISRE